MLKRKLSQNSLPDGAEKLSRSSNITDDSDPFRKSSMPPVDQENLDRPPQKKFFRQRAHANIFSDQEFAYPAKPQDYDWSEHYPTVFKEGNSLSAATKCVEFADIGCGYGGLLMSLATKFPDKLMLGMEIRHKVEEYVKRRIVAYRLQHSGSFENISVIRMNAMKFMPNFFKKGQLEKLFFLFPDPHFKKKKHKARIISTTLLAEYAYCLRPGGLIYTATDVRDLHDWMVKHIDDHPLFERVSEERLASDVCVKAVLEDTEEGKKVARNKGDKFLAVYERLDDPEW